MASDYSDSDDGRHRSKRKSKKYSRSRSKSRDRSRSRKSKKSKHKRRSRSHSASSEGRSRRRSPSSERRTRRRSRSRSSEYSSKRRGHRKLRSRSRSHSRSDHDSRRSSRSRDSHKSRGSKTSTDRGKETVTNAQLAEKKLQKALKAAVTADEILRAQGVVDDIAVQPKSSQLTFEEQQKRASAINDIESGEFVQEAFKSNRSEIPLPTGSSVDASHTGAMFSGGSSVVLAATPAATMSCALPTHSNSIMHPNLYIGVEEKMERWKQKVIELRRQKLVADAAI